AVEGSDAVLFGMIVDDDALEHADVMPGNACERVRDGAEPARVDRRGDAARIAVAALRAGRPGDDEAVCAALAADDALEAERPRHVPVHREVLFRSARLDQDALCFSRA